VSVFGVKRRDRVFLADDRPAEVDCRYRLGVRWKLRGCPCDSLVERVGGRYRRTTGGNKLRTVDSGAAVGKPGVDAG
jgi:hypothetical protein